MYNLSNKQTAKDIKEFDEKFNRLGYLKDIIHHIEIESGVLPKTYALHKIPLTLRKSSKI